MIGLVVGIIVVLVIIVLYSVLVVSKLKDVEYLNLDKIAKSNIDEKTANKTEK